MSDRRPAVLVLYNEPSPAAGDAASAAPAAWAESEAGVLAEVDAVCRALAALGLRHRRRAVRRLSDVPALLSAAAEAVVFNLVETFSDRSTDDTLVPALCRSHGKSATGNPTEALVLALAKWQSKLALRAAGLPVPGAVAVPVGQKPPRSLPRGPWIVKPVAADASEGIDGRSVVARRGKALAAAVRAVHEQFGQAALVEQFFGTRELNVAVVERDGKPEMLPPAEIDFAAFAADQPKIVGYSAKWREDSFEFRHTPRIIPAPLTMPQLARVRRCVLGAWRAMGCRGYARVDLRLDEKARPAILEVNPNPDIAPDAGFAAALAAAKIPFEAFVDMMVRQAEAALPQSRPAARSRPARGRAETPAAPQATLRTVRADDRPAVLALLEATAVFRPDEIDVALEVLDEAIAAGPDGHYQARVSVDADDRPTGWVCCGPAPCTLGTWDVYWLAVHPAWQARGIGRQLMACAEGLIARRGGRLSIVETNGRDAYEPTRRFYLRVGYREAARVRDFYGPGDDKIIYTKPAPADPA